MKKIIILILAALALMSCGKQPDETLGETTPKTPDQSVNASVTETETTTTTGTSSLTTATAAPETTALLIEEIDSAAQTPTQAKSPAPPELTADKKGRVISNENLDVSNIKIDVYKSELDSASDGGGVSFYSNHYLFSAYTAEDGTYYYGEPSERYLISVDLNSLPPETGIADVNSRFMQAGTDLAPAFELCGIAKITIENRDFVQLYNKKGETLTANVAVDEIAPVLTEDGRLKSGITVNANGIIKEEIVYDDLSEYPLSERIGILFRNGFIDGDMKAEMTLNGVMSGEIPHTTAVNDELIDYYLANRGTALADRINEYLGFDSEQ